MLRTLLASIGFVLCIWLGLPLMSSFAQNPPKIVSPQAVVLSPSPTSIIIANQPSPINVICSGCSAATVVTIQTIVASPINVTVANVNSNGQQAMTGSSPVVLASDQAVGDKCTFLAKTTTPVSTSATGSTIVAGSAGKQVYICATHIILAAANIESLIEGTGTNCGTGTKAIFGHPTNAASGESYAANGGMTYGSGIGTVGQTTVASNGICLLQNSASLAAGNISYVQQ